MWVVKKHFIARFELHQQEITILSFPTTSINHRVTVFKNISLLSVKMCITYIWQPRYLLSFFVFGVKPLIISAQTLTTSFVNGNVFRVNLPVVTSFPQFWHVFVIVSKRSNKLWELKFSNGEVWKINETKNFCRNVEFRLNCFLRKYHKDLVRVNKCNQF